MLPYAILSSGIIGTSKTALQNSLKSSPFDSIMEFIAALGLVNINKAYADWSSFYKYSPSLQEFSIDLVQLFPRGRHGKNGSDIRMSIDVIEDLSLHQHLDTIVVIGGDSDYIAIAQKVRQRGKTIIGIGVKETTNQYWIKSCNEFKFYSGILVRVVCELRFRGIGI